MTQRALALPCVLLTLLALWFALAHSAGAGVLADPITTLHRLIAMLATPRFWTDTRTTFTAFAWSLLLAMLLGSTIGTTLALNRFLAETFEPILVSFHALPKVTLYPVVLLLCGLGPASKITFGVMHAMVPVVLLTRTAITQIRPVLWRSVKIMRLSPAQTLRHMILPAIAVDLVAALRIGLSLSLLGVLIGEMFASSTGLGFAAMTAMGLGDLPAILAIGTFLSAIAIAANTLLILLEGRLKRGAVLF
jgi:NitT/TauT family transport system permease protein